MSDDKKTIVVWFSCGAASAVAAQNTIKRYGDTHTIRVVNNPIAEEDADNRRFLKDVEAWLGVKIELATNPKFPSNSAEAVWEKQKYMGGVSGAPCTLFLKKQARQLWESTNSFDSLVLGFTVDELARHKRFVENERSNVLPVLIDAGLTKKDCFQILKIAGIELPLAYRLGYPNANCIGCVKATSPTYWNHVRDRHPEVFSRRAKQSREIGARLVRVKRTRIYLDELDPSAKGAKMKSLKNVDCGIFCEEKEEK